MPIIDFKTSHFPPKYGLTDSVHKLTCSWSDIILAAVTVGRKNWDYVTKYGSFSENEMLFRVNMIFAFLKENSRGEIERTENFLALDPSEKVAISYFLGLVGTKLVAEKVFNIPWLMHLDVYTKFAVGPDKVYIEKWKAKRNIRPDLIGLDKRREWVVIEAKGRTNDMGIVNLQEAKDQTKNIKKINGQYPSLRFANSSYFNRNTWKFSAVDPVDYDDNAPDINITLERFYRDYYSAIYNFLRNNETEKITYGNNSYVVSKLIGTSVKIGLEYDIFENLSRDDTQVLVNTVDEYISVQIDSEYIQKSIDIRIEDVENNKKNGFEPSLSVGMDGFVIINY